MRNIVEFTEVIKMRNFVLNRIDDFIQRLNLRGWIVSKIDVQERINVYNQAEQDIEWE